MFKTFYTLPTSSLLSTFNISAQERDEEELTLLRSISKCMENHKLCPSEFPSFAERIALLEERVGKPKIAFAGIN